MGPRFIYFGFTVLHLSHIIDNIKGYATLLGQSRLTCAGGSLDREESLRLALRTLIVRDVGSADPGVTLASAAARLANASLAWSRTTSTTAPISASLIKVRPVLTTFPLRDLWSSPGGTSGRDLDGEGVRADRH